jgi:hypothetical protein
MKQPDMDEKPPYLRLKKDGDYSEYFISIARPSKMDRYDKQYIHSYKNQASLKMPVLYEDVNEYKYLLLRSLGSLFEEYPHCFYIDEAGNLYTCKNFLGDFNTCYLLLLSGLMDMNYWDYELIENKDKDSDLNGFWYFDLDYSPLWWEIKT